MKKRICWITATYFLDVDLPVVPRLMEHYAIDWIIVTSPKQIDSDRAYIESQTDKPFECVLNKGRFFSLQHFLFCKDLVLRIKRGGYDWVYFDQSDYFFLFPLIRHYLGTDRVTIATHNVSIPKGARLPLFAKWSMYYVTSRFKHFQVFSKKQMAVLESKADTPDIFYCPLMLKDYGDKNGRTESSVTRFLFFGNIIPYKRLDILLEAVNILVEQGVGNFAVDVCGYCKPAVWKDKYLPLIKHPEVVHYDIRRIPNELVSSYFNNNDYFVMPYQDIAQSGAMTVAFNYNLPIIASDLESFAEFISDGTDGYFFEAGNADALSKVMKMAIDNTETEYGELKCAQRRMIDRELAPNVVVAKYVEYFNRKLNA